MLVIYRRALGFQRLGAGHRDDVAYPAAVLVLQRPALLLVELVGHARRAHMRRHVALIIFQRPAQAFAVDQQLVELAGHGASGVVAHILLIGLALENALV